MQALYDVPAPAKLNLFLHVVGKRADGYHLLQSLFVLIDWADTLHFERRNDGLLQRHDSGDTLPPDDLCLRAARALQAATGCRLGADIHIEKRLPAGAGMGGGSSDAASTLIALNRLWGLGLTRRQLLDIALPLGADVPFFIGGRHAFVEGIGERLTPLDLPREMRFAVIKPEASIATKDIFSSQCLQRSKSVAIVAGFPAHNSSDAKNATGTENGTDSDASETVVETVRLDAEGIAMLAGGFGKESFGRNDLQKPAEAASAEVVQALVLLQEQFGNSRMTGSGSAVFAHVSGKDGIDEQSIANISKVLPSKWSARICRSLTAHPLRGWLED
ncbi:4-(cytidine 5'-diphospho)-2-C-methyl-D-erythritol kinase [Paucibacter sp. APW11]|uniref:4-diphosphocytidyl-2-C-methyl-D-erythritol kinase n=1 Tax=Roseateles aquae TaxID=3077235 RepID=A0ABU3PE68_9BURK|nr:4-(cytidine 5'-diphospho)-2-C-methyl-D-erythritol kinase [Paucibacter sp. APW11]MDT9000211.1 4-(cytidine 5'-diphospho)-2-C-methyl-D-erythritol kinase [Paucibacter sp. APW11]